MIKLNCPHCKDPVSAHDDGGCAAEVIVSGGTCPCGMGEIEILLEMIEKLAGAAHLAIDLIDAHGLEDCDAMTKLREALEGVVFIEDAKIPA